MRAGHAACLLAVRFALQTAISPPHCPSMRSRVNWRTECTVSWSRRWAKRYARRRNMTRTASFLLVLNLLMSRLGREMTVGGTIRVELRHLRDARSTGHVLRLVRIVRRNLMLGNLHSAERLASALSLLPSPNEPYVKYGNVEWCSLDSISRVSTTPPRPLHICQGN